MDPLVTAQWVGPYEVELPDKTRLAPGQDVVDVPVLEAVLSENWQPVEVAEDPEAAELREIAAAHDVQVAHNAGVDLILERLEDAGIKPVVYRPIEVDVAEIFGQEVAEIVEEAQEAAESSTELAPPPEVPAEAATAQEGGDKPADESNQGGEG